MSDPGKAVFLSYASQDAEAAKRIADALRAAGVEVWFDQSELRGGDAWDAMIRKRIKECVLFVPIITPNTNARAEGYFRLEWKLAVDRSHLMADDAPFLFPVVIGDITDATARVPDKFRDVQWTRLRLDETPGELAGRVARLLAGSVGRDFQIPPPSGKAGFGDPALQKSARWQWWMIFPIAGTLMGLMFAAVPLWKALQGPPAKRTTPATTDIKPLVPDPKPTEVPQPAAAVPVPVRAVSPVVLQGREMLEKYTVDDTQRESLALAEELAKRAQQADVTDADAWALSAQIASSYFVTGRDRSPARVAELNAAAERAMQLAPKSDEALYARAVAYRLRAPMRGEAERLLRDLVQRNPGDRRFVRMLGNVLQNRQAYEEALAVYRQAAALPGGDARAELYGAEMLEKLGRPDEADAAADRSLAVQTTGAAGLFKVNLARKRGDLAKARAELAKVSPAVLLDDRGASVAANVWLWSREPEKVIAALEVIPGDDLYNAFFYGPKSLMLGFAHQLAGRGEVAKLQWRIAAKNLEQRAAADPAMATEPLYLGSKMFLDFLIGDPDKQAGALQTLRIYLQMGVTVQMDPAWDPAKLFTLLDRQDIMIDLAEMILKSGEMPNLREELRTSPLYAPLRGNPRFDALLKEPEVKKE